MTVGRIFIVSRTKMSGDSICVGAFDVDNRRNIRLLNALGHNHSANFPLQIGNVAVATYINRAGAVAPHTEDVLLQTHSPCISEKEVISLINQLANIIEGPITNCFGGRLFSPDGGAMAIRRNNLSDHSVCFWKANRELILNRFGKYEYRAERVSTTVKYVGFQEPLRLIPAGTVLRLSLSRWWNIDDREKYCWLQLSGWYL